MSLDSLGGPAGASGLGVRIFWCGIWGSQFWEVETGGSVLSSGRAISALAVSCRSCHGCSKTLNQFQDWGRGSSDVAG